MTAQERIERDLRMFIGDLQVQILMLKAHVAELQEDLAERDKKSQEPGPELPPKHNGKVKEASLNG
jgi:hypothetical protein